MTKSTVIVMRKDNTEHVIYTGSATKVAGMRKTFTRNMPGVIRLWKLGNSDRQILPTQAAVDKLISILKAGVTDGAIDLVWDDMIDLSVSSKSSLVDIGENIFVNLEAVWAIRFKIEDEE